MPEEPKTAPPVAGATNKPLKDPNAPKYTPEQQQKAEEKVHADAAKQTEKINKFVDETAKNLVAFLEKEDVNTRTSVVDRIVDRVRHIRTVAANTHLRTSRFAVQNEENKSMPRVITGESRNIMAQKDQNETKELGGKK